jgi:prepilin-type N-terminal cleavage/methylation domain-containing protein
MVRRGFQGFTLIELIVVLAIVALLASIAAPRYVASVDRAREATLRTSLATIRDAIDQFATDRGRWPESLDELVTARYLRAVPEDPITTRRDSWVGLPPPPEAVDASGVFDVRSGAAGRAQDGSLYADW